MQNRRRYYRRYYGMRRMGYGGYGASGGIVISMLVTVATLAAIAWYSLPIVLIAIVGTLFLLFGIKYLCWCFLWAKFVMFPHWNMNKTAYREMYKLASFRLFRK